MRHFDLVIIGSGSGNSLIDERFDGLSIAIIDDGPRYGGTCLNVGCIPTKMFVLPADAAIAPEQAARIGVTQQTTEVDFPGIRDRIFGRIDPISDGGLAWREQQPHVTVLRDTARFVDAHTLQLASGERVSGERIVLAAGSRPRPLAVPVADEVADRVHTSDTIMRIDSLPQRLVVLGSGFISAEFAHVFASYGTQVTVVNRSERFLAGEDADVASRYRDIAAHRMTIALGEPLLRVEQAPDGGVRVVTLREGEVKHHDADLVLNATGRLPNGDRLDVAAAGIRVDSDGFVVVDEHQRTNLDHVWALGDVCSPWLLKHVANHEMRVVQHNLLHPDDLISADHRFVPHAVFGEPQIGAVGATQQQLVDQGRDHVVHVQRYGDVAYGWAMEDTDHFVKLIGDPHTGLLLGAHVIGPQAATLVQQCIHLMSFGQTVAEAARGQYWIHPALPEVIENALLGLDDQMRRWHLAREAGE